MRDRLCRLLLPVLLAACTDAASPGSGVGNKPGEDCTDCTTACNDGIDNDGDGWTDGDDPDCATGDERGLGTTACNDGVDNDGDDRADSDDPDCVSGASDEVLGDGVCADECRLDQVRDGRRCTMWNAATQSWTDEIATGDGHLHDRARVYTQWLRERLMPEGGVMRGYFTNMSFDQVNHYSGTRDSPIWTGIYLATESLRYRETQSSDALDQMDKVIRTLDRWWRISGDRGNLARFVAPAGSPPAIDKIVEAGDLENHRNVSFEGGTWHWKGNISRDQYQGSFFGFALAYDVLDDEDLKEIIRRNIVATVEQLMERKTRQVDLTVDGVPLSQSMELQHVIYNSAEMPNGNPAIDISTSPFDATDRGILLFWPNPAEYLHQIPLLSWLPEIYLRSQAVQLGGMFAIALHVTEGVPAYAERRKKIKAHYDAKFEDWFEMASGWENNNDCGSSYHGLNIAFLPAYNWVRLEKDPTRKARLLSDVFRDRMWAAVSDHKNVFFAYLYASQAAGDTNAIVTSHTAQLRQFPAPPNFDVAIDNRGKYPEDPNCDDQSSIATDVKDRQRASFVWERQPWKLFAEAEANKLYPGVDYLIVYWLARHYGYLQDDAPDTCLQWRD